MAALTLACDSYHCGPDSEETNSKKRRARNLGEKKRRDQFNELVTELYSILPSGTRRMDKSAVLENAIHFLKTNQARADDDIADALSQWKPDFVSSDNFDHLVLDAMDGFVVVLEKKGTIRYVSENVIQSLLYSPDELLKLNIYDYIHVEDHAKVSAALMSNENTSQYLEDKEVSVACRMRHGNSRNDNKARFVDVDLIGILGHFAPRQSAELETGDDLQFYGSISVKNLCLPRVLGAQYVMDVEFTMKHHMDWGMMEIDSKGKPVLGYETFEIAGTSTYDYIHDDDLTKLAAVHKKVSVEGGAESPAYRFRTKGSQWVWLISNYHISFNQWDSKPLYIVSSNRIVSPVSALKSCAMKSTADGHRDAADASEDAAISSTSYKRKRPNETWSDCMKRPESPQVVESSNIDVKPSLEDLMYPPPAKRIMTVHDDAYYATTTLGNIGSTIQQIAPLVKELDTQSASPGRFSGFSSQRAPRVHVNQVQADLWDELQTKFAELRQAFSEQQQQLRQVATVMQTAHQNLGFQGIKRELLPHSTMWSHEGQSEQNVRVQTPSVPQVTHAQSTTPQFAWSPQPGFQAAQIQSDHGCPFSQRLPSRPAGTYSATPQPYRAQYAPQAARGQHGQQASRGQHILDNNNFQVSVSGDEQQWTTPGLRYLPSNQVPDQPCYTTTNV